MLALYFLLKLGVKKSNPTRDRAEQARRVSETGKRASHVAEPVCSPHGGGTCASCRARAARARRDAALEWLEHNHPVLAAHIARASLGAGAASRSGLGHHG